MSDLTMSVATLTRLVPALAGISGRLPAPSPKARYVFAKAADAADRAIKPFGDARQAHMDHFAVKDENGKPLYRPSSIPGMVDFNVLPGEEKAYTDGLNAMMEESVTLPGVRQITRAELGDFPISIEQERAFVAAGLLEDAEPA